MRRCAPIIVVILYFLGYQFLGADLGFLPCAFYSASYLLKFLRLGAEVVRIYTLIHFLLPFLFFHFPFLLYITVLLATTERRSLIAYNGLTSSLLPSKYLGFAQKRLCSA